MPDGLSAQERALIDAAVSEGRVTKCALGATSWPDVVWDPTTRKLVSVDPQGARDRFFKPKSRRSKLHMHSEDIKRCIAEGRGQTETAKLLGLAVETVAKYARTLGLTFPRKTNSVEAYRACADAGKTVQETAAELGVRRQTVEDAALRHGLTFKKRHAK